MSARWRLATILLALVAPSATASEEELRFGRFGTVAIYRGSAQPREVALFVSGDGGWNKGVVDMARELATTGALVVGVDIVHYLKELNGPGDGCLYPASDFEALSQFVQKKLEFPRYIVPVLVGYSSGATLVYATISQAPPNTFSGAVSLGFCPDFPTTRPFCKGSGLSWEAGPKGKGVNFLPSTHLSAPWIALQGTVDQVCDPASTEAFVKQVPGGEIVILPKVGHGFSVPRNWLAQFKEAFARITHAGPPPAPPAEATAATVTGDEAAATAGPLVSVGDLPLVEVRPRGVVSDVLAVIVSGDGGWAGIDRELGEAMADRGVAVVGLNSLQYFWKRKTPDGAGADLERIVRHYLTTWRKTRVLLVGYSRGAEALPFMASRLPPELRSKVMLLAMLGPTPEVEFEFHVGDWLGGSGGKDQLPVKPEVEKLSGVKVLCVHGDEESDSLCPSLGAGVATDLVLKGAHHFGGSYKSIAEAILREAGLIPASAGT